MIFLNSNFLLFMIVPLVILGYFIVTNKKELERIFDKKILDKLVIKRNYIGIFGKNILLFLSLFLFIIALSRPVLPKEEIKLKTKLPTVAILLDISASMLSTDIFPNRLEFAKKKIENLLSSTHANILLYVYSDKLYQISPKTSDLNTLLYLVKHLKIDTKLSNSSNLTDALKNIKEKNILLFSDGTDMDDFSQIRKLNKNITIYLTATDTGKPIKKDGEYLKDQNSNIYISKANKKIKAIGKVIPYSYKNDDLKNLLNSNTNDITFTLNKFDELYLYPLWAGFIALFFAFFSPKNIKMFVFLAILLTFPAPSKALFFDFLDIKKANKAYHDKNYKKAIKYFLKVANSKQSPSSYYNLANAYYKNKEYKKALEFYKKVIAKNKELRYKTFYNIGNCYFKLKNYDKAYEFYLIAYSVKKSKKLEKNLLSIQKYIKNPKTKIKLANIIQNQENKELEDLQINTIMIPITKGEKDETKPW